MIISEKRLRKIIRESLDEIINTSNNDINAIKQIDKISKDIYGVEFTRNGDNPIHEVINDYFYDFDSWKNYDEDCPMKVTNSGLYNLAYVLCSYDFITITDGGNIDVEHSNNPKIARIVKQIVPKNILLKINDK